MATNQLSYVNELKSLSLLSATTGQLEIVRIPVVDKPDWIIPRSLILAVIPFSERIWTYLWQADNSKAQEAITTTITNPALLERMFKQEIAVYHLFPKTLTPTYIVVVESFTDVHRLGLQIAGEVAYHHIRIADLKDADTLASDDNDHEQMSTIIPQLLNTGDSTLTAEGHDDNSDLRDNITQQDNRNLAPQSVEQTFIFQPVMFQGELCVVPDLDKLSHYLVDLDS